MIVTKTAYPRAGLIGNPSDGYWGKTMAFTFRNFSAEVTLYETPELQILPDKRDHSVFESIEQLVYDVNLFGYYGGIRLLKASIRRFHRYCEKQGIELHDRNFTVRYKSDIPHLVGLAGSSAIITACCRALETFYGVTIPNHDFANLVLETETKELGISAGLQDRVAQAYEGLVYMDFDKEHMDSRGYGRYETIDPGLLPNLYIAYNADLSEGSEVLHNDLRVRFDNGDKDVHDAVELWAGLTDKARACLESGKKEQLGDLLNENYDCRANVCEISEGNREMIKTARDHGCSAKFTGSGGAIIGTYEDDDKLEKLKVKFDDMGIELIKPIL
ncbi:GHMP kinase [bacterium E08(2017)]|nr:GHMP kinase [bacterium E08(2017)]